MAHDDGGGFGRRLILDGAFGIFFGDIILSDELARGIFLDKFILRQESFSHSS